MNAVDLSGWIASMLTLLTFVCRDMRRLRLLALGANIAFIVYGTTAGLTPVWTLHTMLAPLNLWRLRELHARDDAVQPAAACSGTPLVRTAWRAGPRLPLREPVARRARQPLRRQRPARPATGRQAAVRGIIRA